MKLVVGELIPLELQLSDGSAAMFPQAVLRDDTGAIGVYDLAHVANGWYRNDGQTMPNKQYVTATYIVYSDAGHTALASYSRSQDVWQRETASHTAIAAAILAATVEGTVTVGRAMRGLVRTLFGARRSGYDTGSVIVRDLGNTKDSHTIVTTSSGWTSVTLTDLD